MRLLCSFSLALLSFVGCCSSLALAGGFFPAASYPLPDHPVFVAVGDFNGDGVVDLATSNITNQSSDTYSILLGNGDGTFQPAKTYSGAGGRGIATTDLNRDGKLDLVITYFGTVWVLLGNGDGTFQPAGFYSVSTLSYGLTVADFNGDHNTDVVFADQTYGAVEVLLGNGDGTLQPAIRTSVGSFPAYVLAADFNADGKPDLAVSNGGDNTVAILIGKGDGTFQPVVKYSFSVPPVTIAIADFNQDGKLDVVTVLEDNNRVVVLPGNGDGTFGLRILSKVNASKPAIAGVGDFNHDGKIDLAVERYIPMLNIALGVGDGTFVDSGAFPLVGSDQLNGLVADLNGDGWPDIVVPSLNSRNLSVLINKGRGK